MERVMEAPVINPGVVATAVAPAGISPDDPLDGVNLMPSLPGRNNGSSHEALVGCWRSQAAARTDHWKLILPGKAERYLFDLDSANGETKNLIVEQPPMFYAAHVNKGRAAAKRTPLTK